MRILVVGSGGREHALAWRLSRDPEVSGVLVAPGSDGAAESFRRVAASDPASILETCRRESVDLVVIGPEAPLAAGWADTLGDAGVVTYGPGADGARIESSKWFAKEIMRSAGVPTAAAELHQSLETALADLRRREPPYVIKADGLASGKGVLVTSDRAEAESFLGDCLVGSRFGASGRKALIEDYVDGSEASVMAICSGERHVMLPVARDFKRADGGDRGPNTGGMGAYAPMEIDSSVEEEIGTRILAPVLEALAARGTPYRGTLYAGLMLGPRGVSVLEFNCRFGDPETQVVLPLISGSLARLLEAAAKGDRELPAVEPTGEAAVSVAIVDEAYPAESRGGGPLEGLDLLAHDPRAVVFHAAAIRDGRGWRVRGGRAVHVTAVGKDLVEARREVDRAIDSLGGSGWRCRRDIAGTAVSRTSGPAAGVGSR